MLRRGAAAGVVACVVALAAAASTAADTSRERSELAPELAARLGRALASPDLDPAQTSALVVDLRSGRVVFQRNPSLSLAPASAEKLGVAFAALRSLGSAFRFRTEVRGSGELSRHIWNGDLHLVGYGDPTLDMADLETLARDVRSWGIKRVTGSIVGDERHYDARRTARGWKRSFLGIESPPLSALSVGELPVRGPNSSAGVAAAAFRAALARRGVTVGGRATTGRTPPDTLPLALDLSEPLSEIVLHMNHDSDNFVAEMLLKELGAAISGRGSSATGAAVVEDVLEGAGVPLPGVRFVDGSGLSVLDRMTSKALVVLLRAADRDRAIRDVFIASLPVAGVSGTLRDRLGRRVTRGKVVAKTGTTSRASALVGFVRRRYAFAILQNGSPVPYWSARVAQDRFVTVLARS